MKIMLSICLLNKQTNSNHNNKNCFLHFILTRPRVMLTSCLLQCYQILCCFLMLYNLSYFLLRNDVKPFRAYNLDNKTRCGFMFINALKVRHCSIMRRNRKATFWVEKVEASWLLGTSSPASECLTPAPPKVVLF